MPDRSPVSRRTALGLAVLGVAGVAASGCDLDDLRPPADDPTPGPTPVEPAEPMADEQIVTEVLAALASAVSLLRAARRVPEQRSILTPLLRAHREHTAALGGPVDAAPTTTTVTLAAVRSAEQSLRVLLVDAAARAESGALARLLASASASVSQHLVTLT